MPVHGMPTFDYRTDALVSSLQCKVARIFTRTREHAVNPAMLTFVTILCLKIFWFGVFRRPLRVHGKSLEYQVTVRQSKMQLSLDYNRLAKGCYRK